MSVEILRSAADEINVQAVHGAKCSDRGRPAFRSYERTVIVIVFLFIDLSFVQLSRRVLCSVSQP